MKLDFNFNLKDLDGNDIQGGEAGKIVANLLAQGSKGDALKFWDWALKINQKKVIDVEISDASLLESFIKDHEGLPVLTKAQLLLVFKK